MHPCQSPKDTLIAGHVLLWAAGPVSSRAWRPAVGCDGLLAANNRLCDPEVSQRSPVFF